MKVKGFAAIALAALVASALTAPAAVAQKKGGPKVVGTDDAGDWGSNTDPTLGPVGNALGQDLVEAAIQMDDMKTINFIIKLNSLPASGGVPELSRYTWNFKVDGEDVELDGKFTNFSRGTCDPTSGACPPPRNPGTQPFFIRGECGPAEGTSVTLCKELGVVQASFDSSEATITIPVPAELIHAKPGSKIEPGQSIFGGSISAAPSAFFTMNSFPMDTLAVTETFVVASGKKAKKKKK
jgi:hypothetical protein